MVVALSRARFAMYVLGNARLLDKSEMPHWQQTMRLLQRPWKGPFPFHLPLLSPPYPMPNPPVSPRGGWRSFWNFGFILYSHYFLISVCVYLCIEMKNSSLRSYITAAAYFQTIRPLTSLHHPSSAR